jgi:hypothetical protein
MKYLITFLNLQFIIILIYNVTFGQVQTEEYVADEHTVLLLHLNETGGPTVYDASQNGNDGTINGNQPSEGKFGTGWSFPSNTNDMGITLPNSPSLNMTAPSPITLEAWVKMDAHSPGGTDIISIDEYQLILGSFGGSGYLQFFVRDGDNWQIFHSQEQIALNEWVHVAGTWDGSTAKIYINGDEKPFNLIINPFTVDSRPKRVASFLGDQVGPNATVLIDEVRISNIARDEKLVAYYPFDGNANDESGNGNDGDVQGATITADRFGNCNSAYYFDGTDDEIILGSEAFNFAYQSYSISLWANWDKPSNLGTHILDKQGYPVNGGGGYRLYTGTTTAGKIIFAVSTEVYGYGFVEYNTNIIPEVNTWYHIVVIADVSGNTTVYINGEAKVTALTEPLIENPFDLKLGRRIDFDGSRFKVEIDDVRIVCLLNLSDIF